MVFESLVADLLNRFLGDFVDNLDSSQLNIGIWGGDVKLENLEVKESALDDFDLPIKLKFGYLESLILKIPWKNLYTEPVIATIDGLYLIAVPNKGVVYNEEKAKKTAAEIKQKTLVRLEEARKNRRKPTDPQADTFAEKMVTQIIKNLQISIANIHVRYEDKYTNRHRPFVSGVTLESLDFRTTDDNWIPTIHKEAVKIIHKLVSLDNLTLYWNSKAELISDLADKALIKRKLKDTICCGKEKPDGYRYILQPIKMQAKLKLNQKPETDGTDWTTPKIDLAVDMQTIALAIGKLQYQDVLLFLEAQERFTIAGHYLRYRPHLNEYKGHYRKWWKFAYACILEEKVRRRRNNWSWQRMKQHRKLVREYRDAWVLHQTQKSPPHHVTETVKKAESTLDVFNVNVARQQAEMEIDRQGLTRLEDQPQGWIAWGKSWFGGGGGPKGEVHKEQTKKGGKDIASQFQEVMTPEEKAKLFEAIDYQENIPPTNYPREFVENKFDFKLNQVAVMIDGAIALQLLQLKAYVEQRPSAGAMNVVSSIQELRMDGCGAEMLRVRDPSRAWLSLLLDTRPLSGEYDQKVKLSIAPVNLKYHAPAVNNAIDVFKPPDSVRLNQLTALAMSRYEEVKTRSVTGLAHAVENKSKLVLDIHIEPATLMVSEGGIYKANMPTILADLGLLTVKTVHDFGGKESANKTKMESLTEQAYDKFRVQLSNVAVSMAENYQKAHDALSLKESPLQILKPTGLDIQIHKSAIDDLQLPKMKIVGDLPDIVVGISDTRLLMMMKLLNSIPKPEVEPEVVIEEESPVEPVGKLRDRAKMRTIMETDEIDDVIEKNQAPVKEEDKGTSNEQQVQVELDLRLNKIGLVLFRKDAVLCDVSINRMACKLQMRTFDMVITAELGAVRIALPTFSSLDPQRPHLYLIDNNEKEGVLMRLKFVQANSESPFFDTEYRRTEQTVDFQFSKLNVCLHQEGLLELKQFGEKLQAEMAKLETPKPTSRLEETMEERTRKISRAISSSVESLTALARSSQSEAAIEKRKARKERAMVEADPTVIKMRVEAKIGSLALLMGTERNGLETKFAIEKVTAYIGMTIKATDVTASLEAITIEDCTKGALYKKLMSVAGDREMLKFEMTQYQRTEAEKHGMEPTDVDMKVQVRLAQMRFVFLNLWLVRLMNWLSPFQEEAQKAAAAAQQAASEKAKEAAENVKQILEASPPRIELDVELEAPMIVVPRLSSSPDVIVALLGNVSVKNKITGHKDHKKAVLDRMEIQLTEMALSIGSMNEDSSKTVSTCPILNPLTFTINCHRNLTFATVKNIPEIAVNAKIPAIEMNMSEQDYTTIMQTLSGNLAEGKDETVPLPIQTVSVESPPSSDSSEEEEEEEEARDKKKSTVTPKKSTVTPSDRIATTGPPASSFNRIVFQFSLDKIVAVLYTGGTEHGTVRRAEDAFAAMRLNDLKLSGLIKEDNALDVSMSLATFTMNDERKTLTKINRLMDKKPDHEKEQFLALRFSQNNDNDRNVACTMAAFYICLCPEFLGCLARFFAVPASEEQQEQQAVTTKGTASTSGSKTAAAPIQTASAGSLTIDCTMNGIEVILVENSMEPDTSQALILSFNINLDAKPSDKVTTMKGGVEKLAVFSSYYAHSRRNEVTYEVLKPMDIGVEVMMDAKTKACEAVLKMSPMEVKMSPSVIRLLSNVNAEFAKSSQVDSSAPSSAPKQRCYANYWAKSRIDRKNYWFLNVPTAEEATECLEAEDDLPVKPPQETAKILMERISFTLEAGNALIPVPMIFLDLLVNAEAANWSSTLKASADVSVQMSYYNEAFSVWEPVIEQVEVAPEKFERWNVRALVKGRNKLDPTDTSPATDVKIEADKILNVTVTKSFLRLLNQLSEVFAQAAKQISPPSSRALPGTSQFVLRNETGLSVKILDSESISVSGLNEATHGSYANLEMKKQGANRTLTAQNCLAINHEELQALLRLDVVDNVRELKIGRAERRSIPLSKRSEAGKQWKVIAKTTIENSRRLVTLSSHIRVKNHLDVAMEIYGKRDSSSLDLFGAVQPGETLTLPVPLLYTATGEIFFKPANDKCEVSFESLSWHNFEEDPCKRQIIRCDLSSDLSQGYFFETVLKTKEVEESAEKAGFQHTIHLYLPLQFHNNLPIPVTIEQPIGQDLQPGESIQLNAISGSRLKLWASYLGEMCSLDMKIPTEKKDVDVVALNTETGSKEFLLGLNWSHEHGDQKVYLFAPFWLVNNTALPLRHAESTGFLSSARGCVSCHKKSRADIEDELDTTVIHPPDDNPLILPFPSADLSKKKKGKVQIENVSGWSDEIPLDVVGNPSRIVCKAADRDYEMTVDIKLCQSGLTKVVTFTPFYLVSNLSRFDMQVKEDQQKSWVIVPAEKCVGVWPVSRGKKKLYSARYADSQHESLLFPIAENLETMCEIAGDVAGVNVSVSTSESSVAIHLSPFVGGCAPVCIMNTLKIPVSYGQKGHKRMELGCNEMAYFTWASITENRVLEMECGDWKNEDMLEMNQLHNVSTDKTHHKCVYMTSFLLGRQRTILFTDDLDIAHSAHGSWEQDTVDMQAEVNLQGIGLSVVDNLAGKEILYVGISSSDILWEEESKPNSGRFKPLAVKVMEQLEEKYQQHLVQPNHDYQSLDQFEVNLAFMILKKKKGKEFKIRRTFERGIWMNYGQSYQRKRLHFKLNHLQIDNQLDACIFPRVLAIVPPPKSIVQDNAPKPFVELSFRQRVSEFSTVPEIEYAKVLVQEFAIQVDIGLLNSLMALVASQGQSKPYGKEMFDQDYEMANMKLEDTAKLYKAMRPKSFYNELHISPLMIHLSFSQGGATDQNIIQSEFINLFMKSVGVSLTELQDVVFKLAYFERLCVFYSPDQLNSEVFSHYTKQFLKQFYVLVFGLDIIGNPFGLVRDLSAGVEDLFYQPFQGLVQGPEEFIQGVGIGVQSMFGHALGGAAGAVGRITGTVGKGVAALTFDQEYQKKRQEDINRRPQNIGEGMARGFKGLGMGLMDGVTGLVTKPAEGLRKEGAAGLFKGVGKGLIGVVARPVSGVVDFASGTMSTIRTVAGTNRDAAALRPSRVIGEDKIIRPFSSVEAVGYKIYKDTDRGALAETNQFVTYAPITDRMALLVTNNQLVLVKRTDIMGIWTVDWQTEYGKVHEPTFVDGGIKILLKEKKKGFLGIGASEGKIITFPNSEMIQQKVLAAYRAATSK